ncbi:hypothetical protein HK100_004188 [Physocladia obscura]|uniref:FAD-binding domain-containing protein n=1 Tax=Physocladia obscura TaxID=109957 RepID=A0AAD5ST67_9FUNG|nr:hypothetical protein HK100_004188 [Physocladia obscura]
MNNAVHVIIIGAGIGGLTLAQGLRKQGIPFSVYERDTAINSRPQGYRLRLNNDGYNSLEKTLSETVFTQFLATATTTQAFEAVNSARQEKPSNIDAITGYEFPHEQGRGPPPPHAGFDPSKVKSVDRTVFRTLLALDLPINFDHEYESHTTKPDGHVLVTFKNGKCVTGTLLVSASGGFSKFRPPNTQHNLDTTGRAIYGKTPLTPAFEAVFPVSALQTTAAIGTRSPLVTMLTEPVRFNPAVYNAIPGLAIPPAYMYWVLVTNAETFGQYMSDAEISASRNNSEVVKEVVLKIATDWHPSIKILFEMQSTRDTAALRISTTPSDIAPWPSTTNVTYIGDAAHAMSPTAGLGANTALKDAALLCKLITEKGISESVISEYEVEMRKYAGVAINASRMGGVKFYNQPDFAACKEIV